MAIPFPIPDPATGIWDPFALKQNLHYLDRKTPPRNTSALGVYNNADWTAVGTGANTDETTVGAFGLPANTMSNVDDTLYITGSFTTAANANTKRMRLYLGSSLLFDTGAEVMNNQLGVIEVWVPYIAPTSQSAHGRAIWSSIAAPAAPTRWATIRVTTEDWRTNLTVTYTMQNGAASADDILAYGLMAILYPRRDA